MRTGSAIYTSLAIVVAATLSACAGMAYAAAPPQLAARLQQHVCQVASTEHNTSKPQALEAAARI